MSLTLYFTLLGLLYVGLRVREVLARRRRAARARAEIERGAEAVRYELAHWGGPDFDASWSDKDTEVSVRFDGPDGPAQVRSVGRADREEAMREIAALLRATREEREAAAVPPGSANEGDEVDGPGQPAGEGLPWWREALGISATDGLDVAEEAWRRLAKSAHPDVGGSAGAMAEINRARDEARRALA